MSITTRVKRIIAEHLNLSPEDIAVTSDISAYGPDSLDLVEIVFLLEEEFGIDISDEACKSLKTVGDIIAFVEKS